MPARTSTIFRPRRYDKVLSGAAILLSLLFVVAGVACFPVVELQVFSFVFTVLGLIAIAAVVGSMFTRTIITPDGIMKRPVTSGGFSLQWRDVDSWEQIPRKSDDAPCVRFRIRGSRFPRVVFDYEVERPGFEPFVSYVRQYASQREAACPQTWL